MRLALTGVLIVMLGCSRPSTTSSTSTGPAPDASPPPVAKRGWGSVMTEVGRRFELAGKASAARRHELAAYQVGELEELFENDLPGAELPKEGNPAALPGLSDAFVKTVLPDLTKAANAKDPRVFAEAFQRASASCNACHQASGHGFIQIPAVPGKSVPDLEPLAAP